MGGRLLFWILLGVSLFLAVSSVEAKALDPYKVLGVDRNAGQREIQKAFHKLSLQYHPDKNKNKGAQEKFAEINDAYEILGDEEKRKNYDLYGDEKGNPGFEGNPGFDAGHPGGQGGYSYFTSGDGAQNGFNFRPGSWQNMGGQGSSKSFSFSFGGPSFESPFGFGMDDIFNMFGGASGGGFSGFGGSTKSQPSSRPGPASSPKSLKDVKPQSFKKEVVDQGMTWLLLSYTPSLRGVQEYESIVQEIANSLQGALKVGGINCEREASFCRELGIQPHRSPRLFIYSYKENEKGSLVEYKGDLVAKSLNSFCQDQLPRFSKRVDLQNLNSFSGRTQTLPRVLLLSTKKDTPVIWRVLSGLYHKRFTFNDVQVQDVSDPLVKKLGVDALPALVGWLSNGEKHVLKAGIAVKDLKSAVHDLGAILDGFEKKNKKATSSQDRKESSGSAGKIPFLTQQNFDTLCGETNPVCIIGAFRSSKAREKLESVLTSVSQKSFTRRSVSGSGDSISYALLDATKHPAFLSAFDKSGFKTSDKVILAYKPRKSKFATLEGDGTMEDAERFVGYVLSGDVQFKKTRQKPVMK